MSSVAVTSGKAAELAAARHADTGSRTVLLHVPGMRCAGCISGVERRILVLPGVVRARANLTRKQIRIEANPSVSEQQLVAALAEGGFDAHAIDADHLPDTDGREIRSMLMRLAVAGFGMMNVMLLSVSVWSGAEAATGRLLNLIAALITVPVIAYAARPFFASAVGALRARRLNMDVPIALAIALSVLNSLHTTMTGRGHTYFDAALALTFFLLGGRYLDLLVRRKAQSAAANLARIRPKEARRIEEGRTVTINASMLQSGDLIEIRSGDIIPADGLVETGQSDADRSMLTGEALPVRLMPGAMACAGDVNMGGLLQLRVTAPPGEATLDRFIDLTSVAEQGGNRYKALADRAAALYAPLVHLTALTAFGFWLVEGSGMQFAIDTAIAVLIITCPCALGLAVPAVISMANTKLFSAGILFKDSTALERLALVDTLLFDKTGTLTTGHFDLADLPDIADDQLAVLRALADASHHPYAAAISKALAKRPLSGVEVRDITESPGKGISGTVAGDIARLGAPDWVGFERQMPEGCCGLGFVIGDQKGWFLPLAEQIRPGVRQMLARLDEAGYQRVMLTGDRVELAGRLAAELGFATWRGGLSPAQKLDEITALQAAGAKVVMIGDGINDIGAMAQAGLSIAPASARDATRLTASVVLLGDRIDRLPGLLAIARQARLRILQNFGMAAAYNLVAVPVAFAGLATPLIAALAMSASSLSVSLNALRLRVNAPDQGDAP